MDFRKVIIKKLANKPLEPSAALPARCSRVLRGLQFPAQTARRAALSERLNALRLSGAFCGLKK